MNTISVGLWATNLEIPAVSFSAWLDFIEARMGNSSMQASGFSYCPNLPVLSGSALHLQACR